MSDYTIFSPINFEITQEQYDLLIKWVDELKSGNYRQGKGYLCNGDNEYCCLGVLGEIAPNIRKSKLPIAYNYNYNFYNVDNSNRIYATGLAEEFISLTGIQEIISYKNYTIINKESKVIKYTNNNFENILMNMNDEMELSFIEIANIIYDFIEIYIEDYVIR